MPHRPLAVANDFIRQFGGSGSISHLKLQKLTYFAQGWWLALKGTELVIERPEVWRYGPVFQSIYHAFSGAGDASITHLEGANPFGDGEPPSLQAIAFESERRMVEWVWQQYGNLSGPQLSDLTHASGTPWREIAEKRNFRVPMNTPIPEEADWKYFAKLAEDRGFTPRPLER